MPAFSLDPAEIRKTVQLGIRLPSTLENRFTIRVHGNEERSEEILSHIGRSYHEAGISLTGRYIAEPVFKRDVYGNSILVCELAVYPRDRAEASPFTTLFMQFKRGRWDRPVSYYHVAWMRYQARRLDMFKYKPQPG